jgi:hypothetical protein
MSLHDKVILGAAKNLSERPLMELILPAPVPQAQVSVLRLRRYAPTLRVSGSEGFRVTSDVLILSVSV